jgi:hypothetical protein
MPDPTHLRDAAARLFALSMQVEDQDLAGHLALRASDYLTQAEEMEREAADARKPEKDAEPA